jgi:hypothetical protein
MLSMHFTIGLALAIAGALMPRIVSRAKLRLSVKFLLDLVPSLLGFTIIAALTARPILAGTVILSLMIGFAFVDWVKRATLLEPAVFSDLGELIELFRHPDLYLPFAGPIRVILTAIGIFILFAILFVFETPAWAWSPIRAFALPLAIIAAGWAIHGPFIRQTAQLFRRLNPTGDPFRDAPDPPAKPRPANRSRHWSWDAQPAQRRWWSCSRSPFSIPGDFTPAYRPISFPILKPAGNSAFNPAA